MWEHILTALTDSLDTGVCSVVLWCRDLLIRRFDMEHMSVEIE